MSLPNPADRLPSRAIPLEDARRTRLGKGHAEALSEHPGENGLHLLRSGRDAFVARAVLAERAERSIDLQYYIFSQDTVGSLLIRRLLQAADRGVRVRMLIDDLYGSAGEDSWVGLDVHPAVEVRLFNPWIRGRSRALQYVWRRSELNHRMHSKSYTVDNQVAILGGRNIADAFFEADPDTAFTDRDIALVGPAVQEVETAFDEYWNSSHSIPVADLVRTGTAGDLQRLRDRVETAHGGDRSTAYIEALRATQLADALREDDVRYVWAKAKIIYDAPEKADRGSSGPDELLFSELAPYITAAQRDVVIISPYFVPGRRGANALRKLSKEGVRVRVLTNSLASNDVPAVHAGYARYRRELLRSGVELYEINEAIRLQKAQLFSWLPALNKSALHAKSMVFDRETMFVGSFNFDRRSLHINNEIGVVIEDAAVASEAVDFFDGLIDDVALRVSLVSGARERESLEWTGREAGRHVVYRTEPHAGRGLRMIVAALRALPIESQL